MFHMLGRRIRHKDAFLYASKNLIGKSAIIMNADCYVDKGFELLDKNILSNKTMYALTRHAPPANSGLCPVPGPFKCDPGSRYYGSHDAWVFRLRAPLPDKVLNNIDYLPHLEGIEQVLMFHLRTSGGFTIKNPCKILQIVHYHCIRAPELGKYQYVGNLRLDWKLGLNTRKKGHLVLAKFSGL